MNYALTNWYDRLWAALIFFTRLPFWRIHQPPKEAYQCVVEFWPLAGWLTAGVMAGVLYGASLVFSYEIAIVLAIASRILLTGALHEDGLADFFDGFGGGGNDRQRILDIMKDSHIGTYGVLALVIYMVLLFFTLHSLQPTDAALTILAADPYAKMLSAQVIQMMPYARTADSAKNKTVYRQFSTAAGLGLAIQGLLPMGFYLWWMQGRVTWSALIFLPGLTMYFLYLFIWRRLRGYTGDCCGALFLLTELTAYLVVSYCLAHP
ncbi:MAG: adenosylcobinamide-GDP ribazoletransferase [Bacteroidaceae bacterium]|nr:adenosylcobinamide-GDP ribazoletransferase [Bacteroidaceae bacterium]